MVCPVHVFHDQQHGPVLSQATQQLQQKLEQADLRQLAGALAPRLTCDQHHPRSPGTGTLPCRRKNIELPAAPGKSMTIDSH